MSNKTCCLPELDLEVGSQTLDSILVQGNTRWKQTTWSIRMVEGQVNLLLTRLCNIVDDNSNINHGEITANHCHPPARHSLMTHLNAIKRHLLYWRHVGNLWPSGNMSNLQFYLPPRRRDSNPLPSQHLCQSYVVCIYCRLISNYRYHDSPLFI